MKRASTVAVLLVALICVAMAGGLRAQTTISLNEYTARLETSIQMLRTAPPGGDADAAIDAALHPVGLPLSVELPDGTSPVVTEGSLLGGVRSESGPTELTRAAERLQASVDAARGVGSASSPDPASIHAALTEAYAGLRSTSPPLIDRILSDIQQAIGWFFDHTLNALVRSGTGGLLTWVVLLGVGVAILMFARRVRSGVVTEARLDATTGEERDVDWRRAADKAIAAGEWAAAVRALYHVLLATLAARGVVHDAPSLTAGECRRAVLRARPALAAPVDRATDTFERVAYGNHPADADDVEILRTAERAVRRS